MLTIRNGKDEIVIEKKTLRTFLSGSSLDYLSVEDEYTPNTDIDFQDILTKFNISDDPDNWLAFGEFMQKKTIFDRAPIIDKYEDSISILTQSLSPSNIMHRMSIDIIKNNIPQIIKELKLNFIYEQLIFYEYIYKSASVSYSYKLEIISENGYELLLNLLDECYLDIYTETLISNNKNTTKICDDCSCESGCDCDCDSESEDQNTTHNKYITEESDTIKSELVNYYLSIYFNSFKNNMVIKFIDIHSSWLPIDTKELSELIEVRFIKDPDSVVDKNIPIQSLCLLNTMYHIYQSNVSKLLSSFLSNLEIKIPTSMTIMTISNTEQYNFYLGVDLIIRLMENNDDIVNKIPKRQQLKILALWLKLSYPQKLYVYHTLILSPMILSLLQDLNITFYEMAHILYMDRLDIFAILCKRLDFKRIHSDLFRFLPYNILHYIIHKNISNKDIINIDIPDKIKFNIYELIGKEKQSIHNTFQELYDLLNSPKCNKNELIIEYETLFNKNEHYLECPYIIMYWNYIEILTTNSQMLAIIADLLNWVIYTKESNITNSDKKIIDVTNINLDIIILMVVLNNINFNDQTSIKIIHNFTKNILSDNDIYITGPDFCEIRDELIRYNVTNLSFLDDLCHRQEIESSI